MSETFAVLSAAVMWCYHSGSRMTCDFGIIQSATKIAYLTGKCLEDSEEWYFRQGNDGSDYAEKTDYVMYANFHFLIFVMCFLSLGLHAAARYAQNRDSKLSTALGLAANAGENANIAMESASKEVTALRNALAERLGVPGQRQQFAEWKLYILLKMFALPYLLFLLAFLAFAMRGTFDVFWLLRMYIQKYAQFRQGVPFGARILHRHFKTSVEFFKISVYAPEPLWHAMPTEAWCVASVHSGTDYQSAKYGCHFEQQPFNIKVVTTVYAFLWLAFIATLVSLISWMYSFNSQAERIAFYRNFAPEAHINSLKILDMRLGREGYYWYSRIWTCRSRSLMCELIRQELVQESQQLECVNAEINTGKKSE
ncbi:hypothetical protein L596_010812 [Steinernema carpocapsae]|nr:hypothetical protein L596_027060 [Steinernema carpocapsae]TKR63245.1 hypothetical protein L596_027094 [Steinernema carpocapsae]TKR96857.1 hypothetical protein L596_010812 [Steinernema carpocapsae]